MGVATVFGWLVAIGSAHADVKADAAKAYETAERALSGLSMGGNMKVVIGEASDAAMACGSVFDGAWKAGTMTGKDLIDVGRLGKIPGATAKGKTFEAPAQAVRDRCLDIWMEVQKFSVNYVLKVAWNYLAIARNNGLPPMLDEDKVGECTEEVAWGLKAKLAPDTVFVMGDGKTRIRLDQAQAQVCDALATALAEEKDKRQKASDAKLAPFRAALKGDKIALYEELGVNWYGKNAAILDTPETLAKSDLWFNVLTYEEGGWNKWELRKTKFNKKHMRVGKTTSKTGKGDFPPNNAFK